MLAAPSVAGDISLAFPLECTLGENCYIKQYPDVDPGSDALDYTCGSLVYDGHKGTDIALNSLADLSQDISVQAAASGIVTGTRNNVPDALLGSPNAPDLAGRDCGNGVVIDHGDGWQTQYCHMRQASVSVQIGDSVQQGDPIGIVGISGRTQFPHLHISVRKDGKPVDPFSTNPAQTCGDPFPDDLWDTPLTYQPGGWIGIGFSSGLPDYSDIKAGTAQSNVAGDPDALVLWGFGYGTQSGDLVHLEIIGPNGPLHTRNIELERTQSQMFRASGLRRPKADWPHGTYTGTLTLWRNSEIVDTRSLKLDLP